MNNRYSLNWDQRWKLKADPPQMPPVKEALKATNAEGILQGKAKVLNSSGKDLKWNHMPKSHQASAAHPVRWGLGMILQG